MAGSAPRPGDVPRQGILLDATRLYLLGVTTFTIRNNGDGYYGHVSRPGHPGDQFDVSPTDAEAVAEVLAVYPDAIRVN